MDTQTKEQINAPSAPTQVASVGQQSSPADILRKYRPISADRLNVIGENHPESNTRRDEEKAFCSEMTGSDTYLLEHALLGKNDEGESIEGDPHELRLIHRIHYLNGQIKDVEEKKHIPLFLEQAQMELNVVKQQKKFQYYKPSKVVARFFLTEIETKIGIAIGLFNNPKMRPSEKRNNLNSLIDAIYAISHILYPPQTAQTSSLATQMNAIRIARSIQMHDAASIFHTKRGFWKIGDKHVSDIEEKMKGQPFKYKLIPKARFNTLLNRYMNRHQAQVSTSNDTSPSQEAIRQYPVRKGRTLSTGTNGSAYDDFRSRVYSIRFWDEIKGAKFEAAYYPISKQLVITLPIFFFNNAQGLRSYSPLKRDEMAVFVKSVKATWDNKYKIQTVVSSPPNTPAGKEWRNLNDISVHVNLRHTKNSSDAFLLIANYSQEVLDRARKQSKTQTGSFRTWNMAAFKERQIIFGTNTYALSKAALEGKKQGINEYGRNLFQIFGVDFERQISWKMFAKRVAKTGVERWDELQQRMVRFEEGKPTKYRTGEFMIKGGHTYARINSVSEWKEIKHPDKAMANTANYNFHQMQQFFGREYALEHGLMDSNRRDNSIVNPSPGKGGGEVKKHHYGSFLEALICAVRKVYGKDTVTVKKGLFSKKLKPVNVPNKYSDWTII